MTSYKMSRRISDYFYENHETCKKEYKNNFRHSNHRSVLYIQQYPDKVSYFHVVCVYFTKMFFIHPSLWQRFNFQITQYIYIYIILLPQKKLAVLSRMNFVLVPRKSSLRASYMNVTKFTDLF